MTEYLDHVQIHFPKSAEKCLEIVIHSIAQIAPTLVNIGKNILFKLT